MAHTVRQIYFKTLSLQKFQLQGEVPWTGTLEVINKTLFQLWVMLHWWSQVLTNLSNLLIVINSSVNIVIYAMKDFKFRQVRCAISNTWINALLELSLYIVQTQFQEWDGSLIQRAFKRLLLPGKTVLFVNPNIKTSEDQTSAFNSMKKGKYQFICSDVLISSLVHFSCCTIE